MASYFDYNNPSDPDNYWPQICAFTLEVSGEIAEVAELNHAHFIHGSVATSSHTFVEYDD
jgi:hypothetical protein